MHVLDFFLFFCVEHLTGSRISESSLVVKDFLCSQMIFLMHAKENSNYLMMQSFTVRFFFLNSWKHMLFRGLHPILKHVGHMLLRVRFSKEFRYLKMQLTTSEIFKSTQAD